MSLRVTDKTGGRALAAGGTMLAAAMLVANGGNYVLNVAFARWLSPAEFADANLMVTLLLVITAIAVLLQLLSAHYVGAGVQHGPHHSQPMVSRLEKAAKQSGCIVTALLIVASPLWAQVFHARSPWLFVLLSLGIPAYLLQAVQRGVLQGRLEFKALAITYLVEMIVRVGFGLAFVAGGLGVYGATAALTLSFLATWSSLTFTVPSKTARALVASERSAMRAYVRPMTLLLVGQILINNADVLAAKSFLNAKDAGVYSAIALMGRAIFFLSWSVVTTVFPAVAQRESRGDDSRSLLLGSMAIVSVLCGGMTAGAAMFGDMFFARVLGPNYTGVNGLLVKYALCTSVFAVANLIVAYQVSVGRKREATMLLGASIAQAVLLMVFHQSMNALLIDQFIAMVALLVIVALSTFLTPRQRAHRESTPVSPVSPSVPEVGLAA